MVEDRLELQRNRTFAALVAFVLLALCLAQTAALAYSQYSVNRDATNCRSCHGNFRATSYISLVDGMDWGNLHNLHRTTMLNGDCDACHGVSSTFPVNLSQSTGGTGLSPISCVGCHGRAEDQTANSSYGAGLRQHHFGKGVTICASCHDDANPVNYTPVSEGVLPTYYAHPGTGHPLMPTDPCNANGSENFAGAPIGLDNDGNSLYDQGDSACNSAGVGDQIARAAGGIALRRGYPNPFVTGVSIEYEISGPVRAELRIYDVRGRVVRNLGSPNSPSQVQRVEWDGRDDAGVELPSGVYLCELRSGDARSTMALRLVK